MFWNERELEVELPEDYDSWAKVHPDTAGNLEMSSLPGHARISTIAFGKRPAVRSIRDGKAEKPDAAARKALPDRARYCFSIHMHELLRQAKQP